MMYPLDSRTTSRLAVGELVAPMYVAGRTGVFSAAPVAGVESIGLAAKSTLELDGRDDFCSVRVLAARALAAAERDDHQYHPAAPINARTKTQPKTMLALNRCSGRSARLSERTRSPRGRPALGFP